jgi:hypothetical protein
MEYEFCYDMALLFLETFTEKSTFKLVWTAVVVYRVLTFVLETAVLLSMTAA